MARQRARLNMAPPPASIGTTASSHSSPKVGPRGVISRKGSAPQTTRLSPSAARTTTTRRNNAGVLASPMSEADTLVTASSRAEIDLNLMMMDDEDEDFKRESEECGRWSVVLEFGARKGKEMGFVYDPRALREGMFGGNEEEQRARKRRKLDEGGDVFRKDTGRRRGLVLENEDERCAVVIVGHLRKK